VAEVATTRRQVPFYRRLGFQEERDGWLFAMPTILGLLIFTIGPVVASFYLSMTNYDIVNPPRFVGLANYAQLFGRDDQMRHSLAITVYFALVAVPLGLIIAFLVALLMNAQVKGIALFRTVWYLPALVPAVATGTLWRYLLNTDFGLVNLPLKALGLPPVEWLTDPAWTVPSLILIQLWGIGNTVLIYLAGLQGVPAHLYEAAEIDGAGAWAKFRHVTLPMMSAVVFFNLVLGIIGALQVFTIVYVIFTPQGGTGLAGPEDAALFYVLYLYRIGFQYFRMGYASALAWILFLIIMILTALVFRTQRHWVYYEGERTR
jgi:multiple sugar transport system permease protein